MVRLSHFLALAFFWLNSVLSLPFLSVCVSLSPSSLTFQFNPSSSVYGYQSHELKADGAELVCDPKTNS